MCNNNQLLTPHFALLEFTESSTARRNGIRNQPSPNVVRNLSCLCTHTLEPLREALGLPVVITSGYRCVELNNLINHNSYRSQHLLGQAADFYVGWNESPKGCGLSDNCHTTSRFKLLDANPRQRLVRAFYLIVSHKDIDFDQLILYPNFIHVSYVSREANRHCVMVADGKGRYQRIPRENALTVI